MAVLSGFGAVPFSKRFIVKVLSGLYVVDFKNYEEFNRKNIFCLFLNRGRH